MDTGSKKHIIAERVIDAGISFKLCNLFVSDVGDFKVLSVYSSLSKNLVAYKVLTSHEAENDQWLSDQLFLSHYKVGFNPDFEIIPKVLSADASNSISDSFVIKESIYNPELHLLYGIDLWMKEQKRSKVFLLGNQDIITIIIFKSGECVFSNSFSYADQTEILYFIINAMQLSDFKQEDADLLLDYYCSHKFGLSEFLQPYFKSVNPLEIPFENPDTEIQDLSQLLMPNHLGALCV